MTKRILFFGFLCISLCLAKAPSNSFKKSNDFPTTVGSRTVCNISNWASWIYSNGQSNHAPSGASGGTYPRGTATTIYQDGFLWGGKVDADDDGMWDEIRIGGQHYNIGTQPGCVIVGGDYEDGNFQVADGLHPTSRLYRIRPDVYSLQHEDLIYDAAEQYSVPVTSVTEEMTLEIIEQYVDDWETWPAEYGAPYYDHDQDGVYTVGIDEPGLVNADQVIWFTINDYNMEVASSVAGTRPLGLECQITLWAYDLPYGRMGQTIYKSYKLINWSDTEISDMYFGQWSDPDIGKGGNDFIGCDTVLDLGFCYNGENTDEDYDEFNIPPPAAGYVMLQGPMVESAGDTAYIDFTPVWGSKNLNMTSFIFFPPIGSIDPFPEYNRSWEFYNALRGYKPINEIDPTPWHTGNDENNPATFYPMSGDPVWGTGYIDGTTPWFYPGDRRFMVNSGPVDLAPGDTQEVLIALVGGAGDDCINSLAELKENAKIAKLLYEDKFKNAPQAPKNPNVRVSPFENSLVLEWGSDLERIDLTESVSNAGYEFEGYNVYQLPDGSSLREDAKRVATFDMEGNIGTIYDSRYLDEYNYYTEVPVAYGENTGIQRYIMIDWDHLNDRPLFEGQTYYYAVTAYNQNMNDDRIGYRMYESSLVIFPVTLQEPAQGSALQSYFGQDDFIIEQEAGSGSATFGIKVIDPYAVSGEDYSITFSLNSDSSDLTFNVLDEFGDELSINNLILDDSLSKKPSPIIDGLEIRFIHDETHDPLTVDDIFSFSTAGYERITNDTLINESTDNINVYPNPYYGFNVITDASFEEKVTFTHLPDYAKIRIFNLNGIHVKTIEHYGGQFESWYLGNHQNIRVGSGMYIAHIDMPGIGKEKILKFMIVRGGIY